MQPLLLIGLLLIQAPATPPAGSISGHVTFSDGVPAAGLLLQPIPVANAGPSDRPAPLARIDASGAYRMAVPPGRYYVRVGTNGEVQTFYPGVATQDEAMVVTVGDTAGENINFALPAAASGVRILGHVKFPQGQQGPLPNQSIRLTGSSFPVNVPIAADGAFEISHIRRGTYTLIVNPAPGMEPVPITVGETELKNVELTVPRLVPVTGTVTIDGGSARPRFTIAAQGVQYRANIPVGPEGTFHTELPDGEYLLTVALPPGHYLKSLEAGKSDLQTDLLKVATTDAAISIKATLGLSGGVHVTGRITVTGPNAGSTSMRTLALSGRAVTETAEAPIAADGSFDLAKIVPGSYVARVTLASQLNSPPVFVEIPNRDIRNLAVEIPPEVEVRGRVEVDGYGPPPRFSLALLTGDAPVGPGKSGNLTELSNAALFALARGGAGTRDLVRMNVNALPDGSFKMELPEGAYRIAAAPGANAIPAGYFLRSTSYGSADLLNEPMKVSPERSAELEIAFGTTATDPWVAVAGKVRGFDPLAGPLRVALESRITSAIEVPVGRDGSFEFPRVLQRNNYTARLVPANDAATVPAVPVADKDVTGIEILVPAEKEIRIVATMEDNAPVPVFAMTFAASGSTVTIVGKPERDGSFRAKLPMDERRVSVGSVPLGYKLKSVTYKSTDVLKQPLKISKDDADEMQVAFGPDPALPFGGLSGHINGLDPQHTGVRLVLKGVTSFATFETSVGSDGSFDFSKIPQGTYVPSLLGADVSGFLTPSSVTVSGPDAFSVELAAPTQRGLALGVSTEEEPTGVVLSSLLGSRQAANESTAVAQLRTINTAEVVYLSRNSGSYGTIPQLISAGLLDARFNGPLSGFQWAVIAAGSNYVAAAVPTSESTGRYGYFAMPDAIIRYSTIDNLTPAKQNGKPVN